MTCDGCRFCCWGFGVGALNKPARSACVHECPGGCAVHETSAYPQECRMFRCPYLEGAAIHRPDTFQAVLEELGGTLMCVVPYVPTTVSVERAESVIRETRTILCALQTVHGWTPVALSLDQDGFMTFVGHEAEDRLWAEVCGG